MESQTSNTPQRRLRILGDGEIEAMYGLPHFTDEERLEYFALSPTEKAALEPLHSIPSRIYGILQLGYFKSHHMFFVQRAGKRLKSIQVPAFQCCEQEHSFFFERAVRMTLRRWMAST